MEIYMEMNKKTFNTIAIILMIGLSLGIASAYDLIAGEPFTFDLNETYEYYSIVGNSSIVDLTVTQEGTIVIILTNKYSLTDSFEIIFFNSETEVIHHYTSGKTKYVDKEVLVEVPNYIDREVIKEIEVIKEVPSEPEIIKEKSIWKWVSCSLIVLIILFTIYRITKRNKSNSSQEENITEKEGNLNNGI